MIDDCKNCKNGGNEEDCEVITAGIAYQHQCAEEKEIDDLLEAIWELEENNKTGIHEIEKCKNLKIILERFSELQKRELAEIIDNNVVFTDGGRKRAESIVRRHRLTERMLTDLFEIPQNRIEDPSCEFEHILSEEVTDSICSFLGHPTTCPHGRPIPKGECCRKMVTTIRPLVMPLTELQPGEKGKISFIATKDSHRLQRITSLGIVPDAVVILHQKLPLMIIQVGQTEIAMDKAMVSDIYVKKMNGA